ncbi:VHS domain-containing protein [Entophlyctis helioformis]|nr:VHS domain-containing protein [Entophlyctis helioformis]
MSAARVTQQAIANLSDLLSEVGLDSPATMLEEMIAQACDPSIGQPNLALNLEICDLINKKAKTYPRDAAFAILKHVNRGNTSAAYMAITLLDNCVKNCGYPFHLVLGSKEFLNELVRRFPETPGSIGMTQHRILEMIQLWNATLCVNSRYKEDFKHINDMYRLLMYKGYRFPELSADAVTSFSVDGNGLKTEEELEAEDRKAHGVKLEELLRKGTPAALAQANDLMKIMAGYDPNAKPDYKKEVNQEIDRIESRVILLNDMLNQKRPGDNLKNDGTIEELYSNAKSAQTKLQNFIANNDDEDRLARLLELNDLINTVIQKHRDIRQGKPVQHNDMDRKPTPSSANDKSPIKAGPINLIDFDDFSIPAAPVPAPVPASMSAFAVAAPSSQAAGPSASSNGIATNSLGLLGDLNTIAFNNAPAKQTGMPLAGGFSMGGGFSGSSMSSQPMSQMQSGMAAPAINAPSNTTSNPFAGLENFGGVTLKPASSGSAGMGGFASSAMPATATMGLAPATMSGLQVSPQLSAARTSPNTSPTSGLGSGGHTMQPQLQFQQPAASRPVSGGIDLLSGNNDLLGLGGAFGGGAPVQSGQQQAPFGQSAYPTQAFNTSPTQSALAGPREYQMYDKNGLQIKLRTVAGGQKTSAQAVFINVTPVQFADLKFEVAVPKSMTLAMDKASGSLLAPLNQAQITQNFSIENPSGEQIRLRYRVQYSLNGAIVNETGEFAA